MKLNLRDLFWLILVCALGAALWCERQAGRYRDEVIRAETDNRLTMLQSALVGCQEKLQRLRQRDSN